MINGLEVLEIANAEHEDVAALRGACVTCHACQLRMVMPTCVLKRCQPEYTNNCGCGMKGQIRPKPRFASMQKRHAVSHSFGKFLPKSFEIIAVCDTLLTTQCLNVLVKLWMGRLAGGLL